MAISKQQQERLERLAAMSVDDIDTSDIPEVLDWSGAIRGGFAKLRREPVTISLDADVLAWFKARAEGTENYQSEVNHVLRQYMQQVIGQHKRE